MIKVFIADDHEIVLEGIKKILEAAPHDIRIVGESHTGEGALAWMLKNDFDVAIMDLSMPDLNGFNVFKRLIKAKPKAKLMFLSMHPVDQCAIAAMEKGAMGYMKKESNPKEIIDAVLMISKGKRYIPDYVSDVLFNPDRQIHGAISQREVDIIRMIANGKSPSEISQELYISVKTVSSHKANFMKKMSLKNSADIFMYAISNGLMQENPTTVQRALWDEK